MVGPLTQLGKYTLRQRKPVKLPRFRRSTLALGVAAAVLFIGVPAGAPNAQSRGILWGPVDAPTFTSLTPLDPRIPTGSEQYLHKRQDLPEIYCSTKAPVCAHMEAGIDPAPHLRALETAFADLVVGLGLPAPRPDHARGGSPALDAYFLGDVTPLGGVSEAQSPLALAASTVVADPVLYRENRASAFCLLPPSVTTDLQRQAFYCVAESILLGLNTAAAPAQRRAAVGYFWQLGHARNAHDLQELDELQANPHLSVLRRDLTPESAAAGLWFQFLERRFGRGLTGELTASLFSASRATAAPGAWRFVNEPDVLDVVRHTAGGRPTDAADVAVDFAVARAFLGRRWSATGLPRDDSASGVSNVRFDWNLKLSSLPRRVINDTPLEDLGATYIWLDLDQPTEKITLGFEAEWEGPVAFKWQIVKVDKSGKELARIDVPFLESATKVQRTVANLDGAAALIVVGVNVGGVDLKHPSDPDYEPLEPHRSTVYLVKL